MNSDTFVCRYGAGNWLKHHRAGVTLALDPVGGLLGMGLQRAYADRSTSDAKAGGGDAASAMRQRMRVQRDLTPRPSGDF